MAELPTNQGAAPLHGKMTGPPGGSCTPCGKQLCRASSSCGWTPTPSERSLKTVPLVVFERIAPCNVETRAEQGIDRRAE